MLAVVVSRADDASEHVGEHLRDLTDWCECRDSTRPDADGGGTVYRSDSDGPAVELREVDALHLDTENVAEVFGRVDGEAGQNGREERTPPDLLVFASRHAGETGPLLTAHHTGNVGPAEFGGTDGDLARACPNAHRRVLESLRAHAPSDYDVGMECTHHGPSEVGAPSMFVEVGSDRPQWDDPDAARAVAQAILDLRGVAPDAPAANGDPAGADEARRQLVGFGGGHYAPRFERIARETDWAVGHVAADWALEELDDPADHPATVRQVFEESAATRAVVDGDYPALETPIADLGYRVVSETWVRETMGVPLALVDRLETAVATVDDGLRFGERATVADPVATEGESTDEFEVVDLPAELLAEAQGIDREATLSAVAGATLAYETTQNGTRVGDRGAVDGRADYDALVDALAEVLRQSYDDVERVDGAVLASERAFDPAVASELGVPEGPKFGRLSAGDPVTVDGERVDPADVHETRERRFPVADRFGA